MPPEIQPVEGAPKQDSTGTLIDQSKATVDGTQTSTQKADGSGKDQTQGSQDQKSTEPAKDGKSLLNEGTKPAADVAAPEAYADFTLPDGFEANDEIMTEAKTVFKDLNLPQASAQRLVDMYAKVSQTAAEAPFKLWQDTQADWVSKVKADPEIGGKLDQVKATISKAIDGLGDSKLASDFREAMDYTGAGNNPAFIRAFYRLASKITEGSHVSGAPGGQTAKPRSAASAMYPNLSTGA